MSNFQNFVAWMCASLLLAGCAAASSVNPESTACALAQDASPPSATTPTGPTAMNPPPGYPPLMNPTVPMEVGTTPSNMGHGGARVPSTAAGYGTRSDCDRAPQPAKS